MRKEITKGFEQLRNIVLESSFDQKSDLADDITDLEFKLLDIAKKYRDDIRDKVMSIRESYRPIRSQVETISRACDKAEKCIRD